MARILFLAPYNPEPSAAARHAARHGGVERYVWRLALELTKRGHRVEILGSDERTGTWEEDSIRIHGVRRLAAPYGTPLFNWLTPLLRAECDVVHVQGSYPFLSEDAGVVARVRNLPSVLTYHFDVVGRTRAERLAAESFNRLYVRSLPSYDRVVFHAEDYFLTSPAHDAIDRGRVRFATVGVDTDLFRPIDANRRTRTILFVGRLAPYKGLPVLLDAVRHLRGWELVIVGDGVLRDYVLRRVKEEGLPVRVVGRMSDLELVRLYNEATATVLPSTDRQECQGMSLLESLCCGTPVVTTDMPGRPYVREFGGVLVRPGDAEALARGVEAVGGLSIETSQREALARSAANRFSWARVADRLIDIYREAMGDSV